MNKYDTLNPMQRKAVKMTEGPLLVLAGAGSGKTRVLTHRIAWLMEEMGVEPYHILAITFTNKAAQEMRERVNRLCGRGGEQVWVSTFHSLCVRILRRFIPFLGYQDNFTIYDTDDQKTVMRHVFKALQIDTRQFKEKNVLGVISAAKNAMIDAESYQEDSEGQYPESIFARCYLQYQKELKHNNAVDFDDLLMLTVRLFEENAEALEYYRRRFRYIMVDEYQDTNTVQFQLVKLLAGEHRNLCVVGDDDQSIYRFRGADIRNILDFESAFPGAAVIKLEQNYRSVGHILDAANAVIRNNRGRKDKKLWTANDRGPLVEFYRYNTGYEEAEAIAKALLAKRAQRNARYADFAVLYRTNAQSRLLEEKFLKYNIPYRLIGGVNFYQRREIKDILAYLKTIDSGVDDVAVQRILNVPKRGIGATTMGRAIAYAGDNGINFYQALEQADQIPGLGRASAKIRHFTEVIASLRQKAQTLSLTDLIQEIVDFTGYREELLAEGEMEAESRLENIDEFRNKAVAYAESAEDPSLTGFLSEVALVADVDSLDEDDNRAVLMTIHAAKGLEFPYVIMSGMEEGLFPGMMSIMSGDAGDIEEERRLCYVGITRAEKELVMTAARSRMIHGETRVETVSRFVEEIPEDLIVIHDETEEAGGHEGRRFRWTDEDGLPWNTPAAGSRQGEKTGAGNKSTQSLYSSRRMSDSAAKAGSAPGFGKAWPPAKAEKPDYVPGDRVEHFKYGEGTVRAVEDGKKDYLVTVEFDRRGQLKLYAGPAKLKKID